MSRKTIAARAALACALVCGAVALAVQLPWATGGNPRGMLDQKLPAVTLKNDWTMGAPDLALRMPAEFTLTADKMEDTHEFTLATATPEARWVRAVDLLPGTPSIVRSAIVFVKADAAQEDRKSTRLNSSHLVISYAVFCLKKKKNNNNNV